MWSQFGYRSEDQDKKQDKELQKLYSEKQEVLAGFKKLNQDIQQTREKEQARAMAQKSYIRRLQREGSGL